MKRPSHEAFQLMVLIPFFLSWLFYYLVLTYDIPFYCFFTVNTILICIIGIGSCGLYVSQGKEYIWKDYVFIINVSLAIICIIYWNYHFENSQPISILGLLAGIFLVVSKRNNKPATDINGFWSKDKGLKQYLFTFFLVVTCIGIVFTRFH